MGFSAFILELILKALEGNTPIYPPVIYSVLLFGLSVPTLFLRDGSLDYRWLSSATNGMPAFLRQRALALSFRVLAVTVAVLSYSVIRTELVGDIFLIAAESLAISLFLLCLMLVRIKPSWIVQGIVLISLCLICLDGVLLLGVSTLSWFVCLQIYKRGSVFQDGRLAPPAIRAR